MPLFQVFQWNRIYYLSLKNYQILPRYPHLQMWTILSRNGMEYSKDIKNRLKRIEGQVRGVLRMLDQEEDCKEVITQLSAARSALDRAIALIVATNLEKCIREQMEEGEDQARSEVIKEAVQLLVKSR